MLAVRGRACLSAVFTAELSRLLLTFCPSSKLYPQHKAGMPGEYQGQMKSP